MHYLVNKSNGTLAKAQHLPSMTGTSPFREVTEEEFYSLLEKLKGKRDEEDGRIKVVSDFLKEKEKRDAKAAEKKAKKDAADDAAAKAGPEEEPPEEEGPEATVTEAEFRAMHIEDAREYANRFGVKGMGFDDLVAGLKEEDALLEEGAGE